MLIAANAQALGLRAKLFRGFSDPSRLAVLDALRDGPRSVSAVIEATGLTQSNASSHLSCLHDCGLVSRERQGRQVYYRLADERVNQLLNLSEELLAEVAKGVYQCTRYALAKETGA